jgi:hypothetical protein
LGGGGTDCLRQDAHGNPFSISLEAPLFSSFSFVDFFFCSNQHCRFILLDGGNYSFVVVVLFLLLFDWLCHKQFFFFPVLLSWFDDGGLVLRPAEDSGVLPRPCL